MNEEKNILSLDDVGSALKPFIQPGLHDNVTITAVVAPKETDTGNIEWKALKFVQEDGEAELDIRFYHNRAKEDPAKAAIMVSCRQLNHLLEGATTQAEYRELKKEASFNILEGEDQHDGLLKLYNWLLNKLIGKTLRMKFIGEEKYTKEGIKAITRLGFPPFAEHMTVPKEKSRLTFNKDNAKDWKKAPPDLLSDIGEHKPKDGLPF